MSRTVLLRAVEKSCQLVSRHLAERVRELGITEAEAHLLAHMVGRPSPTVLDLEQALRMRRSTMTSVLDRLEARGLVRRTVNAADRRSFVVSLTAEGTRTAAAVRALWASIERTLRAAVSSDDVAGFLAVAAAVERLLA